MAKSPCSLRRQHPRSLSRRSLVGLVAGLGQLRAGALGVLWIDARSLQARHELGVRQLAT